MSTTNAVKFCKTDAALQVRFKDCTCSPGKKTGVLRRPQHGGLELGLQGDNDAPGLLGLQAGLVQQVQSKDVVGVDQPNPLS